MGCCGSLPVEDAVHEADVQTREQHGGVLDVDLQGPPQILHNDLVDREFALVDLGLGAEHIVTGGFAKALGTAEEDVGCRSLGQGGQEKYKNGPGKPGDFPQGPMPVFFGDGEA